MQPSYTQSEKCGRPGHGSTQAESGCEVGSERVGSDVAGFSSLKHRIGLPWLDARTLEIAQPDDVAMDCRHRTSFHPEQGLSYR